MLEQDILIKAKKDGIKVSGISSDSRTTKRGNIFFAIPGLKISGTKFINSAIKKGACAIVIPFSEKKIIKKKIHVYRVKDIRKSLSVTSFRYYENNIKNKIAITGTNGKTSVLFFMQYLLNSLHKNVGVIGTLGTSLGNSIPSNLTTPDPIFMAKEMKKMNNNEIEYVVVEASSHGLHQKRFFSLEFDLCILTNISHDHLDYHKTLGNYISSKIDLFKSHLSKNGKSLINSETDFLKKIEKQLKKNKIKYTLFSDKRQKIRINKLLIKNNKINTSISINKKSYQFNFKDFPIFQVKNFLLGAVGLYLLGFNLEKLSSFSLKCPHVPGRMELAGEKKNGARVYVDFAHTPDALRNILIEGRQISQGRLIVVFGCGGDRDTKKRSLMGEIAEKYADLTIITDDNPRYENPKKIRRQIIQRSVNRYDFGNRKNAIKKAIALLEMQDTLIIAGKGHEKYQIIKGKSLPFNDVKIVRSFLVK